MKQERASGLIQGTQEEKEADMMHPQRVAEKQAALEEKKEQMRLEILDEDNNEKYKRAMFDAGAD